MLWLICGRDGSDIRWQTGALVFADRRRLRHEDPVLALQNLPPATVI